MSSKQQIEGGDFLAAQIAKYITALSMPKANVFLALGAGNSTHRVYASLIKLYKERPGGFRECHSFQYKRIFFRYRLKAHRHLLV